MALFTFVETLYSCYYIILSYHNYWNGALESFKEQLAQRFVELVDRISAQMRAETSEEWPELELTMPQFKTMALLGRVPERMGAIAGHLNTSLSSATSMIDRLVEKGLVERVADTSDRRVVTCQLTTKGSEEMNRFLRLNQLQFTSIAERLSVDELRLVVDAMEILCAATQRSGKEATNE